MSQVSVSDIRRFELQDGWVRLSFLNYGAVTQGWWVPCKGRPVPVVLGYANPADYLDDPYYLGAIAGRISNRTGGGRFSLGGQSYQLSQNEGATHLHGGTRGLSKRIWQVEQDSAGRSLQFSYLSPDGEEGYPGTARFTVTVSLAGDSVTYDMRAEVDRPTPINLAQHNYYNLMGQGPVWQHVLRVEAEAVTPVDGDGITTGEIVPVAGTACDFRSPCRLGDMDVAREGVDMNLVLAKDRNLDSPVAELSAPNGLKLSITSDQPGMQLYTGGGLGPSDGALSGQSIAPFHGLCLEAQGFPDAVNKPQFPSIIATPDQPYHQRLTVQISEGGQ